MALIEVEWTETVQYTAQVEIDGYDPEQDPNEDGSEVLEAIVSLSSKEIDAAFDSVDDRDVKETKVIRAGDLTPEIKPAKAKEDMF